MKARNLLVDHLSELQSMAMAESFGRYGSMKNLLERRDIVQDAIKELEEVEKQLKKKSVLKQ